MSTAKTAKESQFSGFLSAAKNRIVVPAASEPDSNAEAPTEPLAVTLVQNNGLRGKPKEGKRLAKSTDPEYRSWTGYLKKESIIVAESHLARGKGPPDLSSLLQAMLDDWLQHVK